MEECCARVCLSDRRWCLERQGGGQLGSLSLSVSCICHGLDIGRDMEMLRRRS